MAYSTQYGSSRFDKDVIKQRNWRWLVVGGIVASVIMTQAMYPAQMERLRRAAFPFLNKEACCAFKQMTENVGEDAISKDAIIAFCEEILQGA